MLAVPAFFSRELDLLRAHRAIFKFRIYACRFRNSWKNFSIHNLLRFKFKCFQFSLLMCESCSEAGGTMTPLWRQLFSTIITYFYRGHPRGFISYI